MIEKLYGNIPSLSLNITCLLFGIVSVIIGLYVFYKSQDRFILYRIVEAEAGGGNIQAKKNVAHVIFNRLKSKKFANNVHDVVFDKHQFSPISDGRYWKVTIADSTKDAVIKAYEEGDTTGGALYFANMKYVSNVKTRAWFNSMKCLFTDSINHSFYK